MPVVFRYKGYRFFFFSNEMKEIHLNRCTSMCDVERLRQALDVVADQPCGIVRDDLC